MASIVTAPFEATIEKSLYGEFWVNRYYFDAPDLQSASLLAEQVYNAERTIHRQLVVFTKLSVRSTVLNDYVYQSIPLNTNGLNANPSGHMMPLFVVARVDLSVAGSKPSRKYLRGVLSEDDVNAMDVSSAMVTFINTNYVNPIAGISGFVDPQKADIYGGACSPKTGIRQLRRGSKKKNTP